MNIVLSKDNHLKIGYNKVLNSLRQCIYDEFYFDVGKSLLKYPNYRDACISSACEISDVASSLKCVPLLFYRGSISDKLVISAFLESKRDFTVANIDYKSHKAIQNSKLYDLSKKYNFDVINFTIDLDKHLYDISGLQNAVKDNVYSVEDYFITSITQEIKNRFFPVFNSPEIGIYRNNNNMNVPSTWSIKVYEYSSFYYFHCLNNNLNACVSFNLWSPEVIKSFLLDKQIQDLVNNFIPGKVSLKTTAIEVYRHAFPEYDFLSIELQSHTDRGYRDKIDNLDILLQGKRFYDKHSAAEYLFDDFLAKL